MDVSPIHVYVEKPLSLHYTEARDLCDLAERSGLLLCAAPDTFLGSGGQTARKLLEEGAIGRVTSAAAFSLYSGPEKFHPDPLQFYGDGGGPVYGRPYLLSTLLSLIGPADEVTGMVSAAFSERVIESLPRRGTVFPVGIPTHVCGLVHFRCGCVLTMIESYDAFTTALPPMELQGTEGTMLLPDPNTFGGEVLLCRKGEKNFTPVVSDYPFTENSRGLGVIDMACCLRQGGVPRCSGRMAAHTVEIIEGIYAGAEQRKYIPLESTFSLPAPAPHLRPSRIPRSHSRYL